MDFVDYFRHMALMDQQPSIGQMVQMMGANNLEQKLRQRKATLQEAKKHQGELLETRRFREEIRLEFPLQVGTVTQIKR